MRTQCIWHFVLRRSLLAALVAASAWWGEAWAEQACSSEANRCERPVAVPAAETAEEFVRALLGFGSMSATRPADTQEDAARPARGCPLGARLTRDGYCIPNSSTDYCGGGRYCQRGVCANGGTCCTGLKTYDGNCIPFGRRYCGNGRHCDDQSVCAPGGLRCCPLGTHYPTRDGYCAPVGTAYCGGGRYCTRGRCLGNGRCG